MPYRPAPRDKNTGLVVPPRLLDCIGETCPVALRQGHCFKDDHHLYWPYGLFMKDNAPLLREFRQDRHNIKSMARCRHNSAFRRSEHRKYDGALIPPEDIITTFLDESAILADLGVTATKMAGIVRMLVNLQATENKPDPAQALENLQQYSETFIAKIRVVSSFEVLSALEVQQDLDLCRSSISTISTAGYGNLLLVA